MSHPSFLQLDRFALGLPEPHIADCAECRAHVERCRAAVQVPAPPKAYPWRWLLALPVAALLAVVIVRQNGDSIAAKGAPSVAVYVKHAAAVSLWDGQARVAAGDALQLKVAPSGFPRVTVASVEPAGMVELFAGQISPRGETTLPRSWTIDGAPGPEVLLVIFSRAPLSSPDLRAARDDLPRTRQMWATRMEFWKERP
jgi:hypothetical protein